MTHGGPISNVVCLYDPLRAWQGRIGDRLV